MPDRLIDLAGKTRIHSLAERLVVGVPVEKGLVAVEAINHQPFVRGIALRIVGAHGAARDLLRADGVEDKVGGLDRAATLDKVLRAYAGK